MRPRFIVGTGRCGSTLLSEMLSENPEVLSIYEILVGLDPDFRFQPGTVTGPELAQQLSKDSPLMTIAHQMGIRTSTFSYPDHKPGVRYKLEDPVPWILSIALPHMTEDPDQLFDEFIAEVATYPDGELSQHYRQALAWLAEHLGKRFWIERSGASMDYLPDLIRFFPEGKYLHLHRDGRDAATSMQALPILRAAGALSLGAPPEDIPELLSHEIPIEILGRYWSHQVQTGMAAMPQIPAENFLQVAFEDLVTDTHNTLDQIATFFEIPAGDWINSAAAHCRGMPHSRYDDLGAEEQQRLDEACREAMTLLGRDC